MGKLARSAGGGPPPRPPASNDRRRRRGRHHPGRHQPGGRPPPRSNRWWGGGQDPAHLCRSLSRLQLRPVGGDPPAQRPARRPFPFRAVVSRHAGVFAGTQKRGRARRRSRRASRPAAKPARRSRHAQPEPCTPTECPGGQPGLGLCPAALKMRLLLLTLRRARVTPVRHGAVPTRPPNQLPCRRSGG